MESQDFSIEYGTANLLCLDCDMITEFETVDMLEDGKEQLIYQCLCCGYTFGCLE